MEGRGRGGEGGDVWALERIYERGRARCLDRHRGAPRAEGKDKDLPQAEGEGDGRGAGPAIAGFRLQDVGGEGVRAGEDVAMIVDAALGLAGSAGRERDQGDVVAICVDRSETQGDVLQSLLQLAGAAENGRAHV